MTRLSARFRPGEDNTEVVARLAELNERIGDAEAKLDRVRAEVEEARSSLIPEDAAARSLASFDPVWQSLTPREQGRVIDLLVERVEYDGGKGTVAVTFRPTGINTLADEVAAENTRPREMRA